MRARAQGALLICFSAVLWGLDGVVFTPRLSNLPVPFVVFLLHAVPFLLMQPFLYRTYHTLAAMSRRGWLALMLVSLTGGLLGTIAIVNALFLINFNRLSVVVLLQKLQPVFAILLASILLKERISRRFLTWAFLAVTGAYVLSFGLHLPDISGRPEVAHAAVWAVVAAAAFGAATVLGKQLLGSLDFKQATFARYGVTTVLALLFLVLSGTALPFDQVTPLNWFLVLLISITTGSGAIFLYYRGLNSVTASVATVCELCLPLSAVIFDYLFNHSLLRPWQWFGALIMIGAIVRISTHRSDAT